MRVINLSDAIDAAPLEGTFLTPAHCRILLQEDAEVYKPDGSLLLQFHKQVLPTSACTSAFAALRDFRTYLGGTSNRGVASGKDPYSGKSARREVKKDGTISKTHRALPTDTTLSGIIGYFDRYTRTPYCRQTAFNLNHPEKFVQCLPLIRAVDRVFKAGAPERYAAQRAAVERTHPDFTIHGTAFSTITVNYNWQTAVHTDVGDFRPGFGVLTVLQAGDYDGGVLVFPAYGVGCDIRTGDVLLSDVHEFHGNTPLCGRGAFIRLSLVLYYRTNMEKCGSAQEELEWAKRRQPGDPLWGPPRQERAAHGV